MNVHTDCRYFQGDIPCKPHKAHGVHCQNCPYYDPIKEIILIIKLGAIGDVVRTTPILKRLKEVYPKSVIHWLTHSPEVVPSIVDRTFRFIPEHLEILKATPYNLLLNLDKDREACALANQIRAKEKKGFNLVDGNCRPMDKSAEPKWLTGLFDDINKQNTKSYQQEIFNICGFRFCGEEYILEVQKRGNWKLPKGKPVIGLNTGCGKRWTTRLWPDRHWIQLAKTLKKAGYTVLWLGGEQEDEKNRRFRRLTKTNYMGHFDLQIFVDLIDQCDVVVTAVTMALHLALGLKKKIVLFNNIFNRNEFDLYGRGVILEPSKPCQCCFKNECLEPCMELILPEKVFETVNAVAEKNRD
jgi:ADP-heptose:LPS heptosyltransferase